MKQGLYESFDHFLMPFLQRLLLFFAHPRLAHYIFPILMLYLVAGTLAQKYVGLYTATQIFFLSFIIWAGPVPFPGFLVFIGVLLAGLLARLLFKSPWTRVGAGVIITHLSAVFLIIGGLFTLLCAQEGYIDLAVGETKTEVSDYHAREFLIVDQKKNQVVERIALNDIRTGPVWDGRLFVHFVCRNCTSSLREGAAGEAQQGMAANITLSTVPLLLNDEENTGGITFSVQNQVKDQDDRLSVLENAGNGALFAYEGEPYRAELRKVSRPLPFEVELVAFSRQTYPGTDQPRTYESRVRIHDSGAKWEATIGMNAPLRYKGYTLYQSSFIRTPQGDISVLAVVKNTGRAFPYVAGLLMCLGLVLHLFLRKKRSFLAVLGLGLFCMTGAAQAQTQAHVFNAFGRLPILHEGRIKPMDSFARALWGQLGEPEGDALSLIVSALFDPSFVDQGRAINIKNPDVRSFLGLQKNSENGGFFTLAEVIKALQDRRDLMESIQRAPEEKWTTAQRDLMDLATKTALLSDLTSGVSLFLPLAVLLPKDVSEPLQPYADRRLTYVEALDLLPILKEEIKKQIAAKGSDFQNYTPAEQAVAFLSFSMDRLTIAGDNGTLFRVLPAFGSDEWLTPWQMVLSGQGGPQTTTLFTLWEKMAGAAHEGDFQAMEQFSEKIFKEIEHLAPRQVHRFNLDLERAYNRIAPFDLAAIFYAMAGCVVLFLSFFPATTSTFKKKVWPYLPLIALVFLGGGAAIQTLGIAARIMILQRPPVGTLYESILFVSAVMTLICLFFAVRHKAAEKAFFFISIGSFSGIILYLLSQAHANEGDGFMMLDAVLNTRFWLLTHVLCISIGYAFCLITALIAHVILIKKDGLNDLSSLRGIRQLALVALFFASSGTVLGGIWADQSWGRFWGWDPKENGALLIVLWILWILHGRIAGMISPLFEVAFLAGLGVIVALSWFGVNLLGVGLHAYGFTSGVAGGMVAFILFDILLIGGFIFLKQKIKKEGS